MLEGEKMKKEEPKRPLSPEGQKALDEARSFLNGTQKYDHKLGDYKAPMSRLTGDVAIPSEKALLDTRVKSVRPPKALSPRTLKEAAGHAKSNESRIPDFFT